MSKKIKITESQLKMIMERRHSYVENIDEANEEVNEVKDEEPKEEEECKECGEKMEETIVNEQVEKIKAQFKRFL